MIATQVASKGVPVPGSLMDVFAGSHARKFRFLTVPNHLYISGPQFPLYILVFARIMHYSKYLIICLYANVGGVAW